MVRVVVRRSVKTVLTLAVVGAGALAASAARADAPLLRDFVGINGHSYGFDSTVYQPVSSLVRDYHPMAWDVGDDTANATAFPKGSGGWPNWNADVYGPWTADGFRVNLDVQFESIAPGNWTNMAADARQYGQALASYFGTPASGGTGLAASFEIGNEPGNYSDAQFTTVFSNMAAGIRAVDATTPIVTCNVNVGPVSGQYSKSVELFRPMLSNVDVLAIHTYPYLNLWPTYRQSYPEDTRTSYLSDVQALINWRNQNAPGKQVWVTEFGYDATTKPTGTANNPFTDVTDTQQAQYLTRSYLAFARMGVDRAYMYYYNDNDAASVHAASGLTRNGTPKPAYWALAHLQQTLGDYRFTGVVTEQDGALYVYAFAADGNPHDVYYVAWSPTGSGRSALTTLPALEGTVLSVTEMPLANGPAPMVAYADVGGGQYQIAVGESPIYIHMLAPEPGTVALLGAAGPLLLRRRKARH